MQEHLLKDIHITLQGIKDFNAERSGVLETHLIQGHTHQINSHRELLEIRRELRSMKLGIEGMNDFLDDIIDLLIQSNKEAYSQTAALQYLIQEAKEMEDK
jgi:predicted component of type VI protein secretion system